MKQILPFVMILASFLALSGSAFSQSTKGARSLEVDPLVIEEYVTFGTLVTKTITITNTGEGELQWNATVAYTGQPKVSAPAGDDIFPRGKDPASIGHAPLSRSVSPGPIRDPKGSTGYAFEVNPGHTFFVFNTGDPSNHTVISAIDYTPSGGTFNAVNTEFMYIIDPNTNRLIRVEIPSGEATDIGPCNPVNGESWTGITVDKFTNQMYGISSSLTQSTLYSINVGKGTASVIGPTGIPGAIDVTIDGTGQLYSFSIVTDASYMIDKINGASTLLGSIGFDANYAQGMGYEPLTDIVYLAAFNNATGSGELRILDRETGNTTFAGDLGGEIDALAFPGARSGWLSVDQQSGILPAGASDTITATLSNDLYLPDLIRYGTITFSAGRNADTAVVNVTMLTEGGWYGFLAGYLTHGGAGIPNAVVTATRSNGWSYTATTNAHGRYFIGNMYPFNYYRVSADINGFNQISIPGIEIWPDSITNLDISLTAPVISVTPMELNLNMDPNQTDIRWLTISNTGDGPVEVRASAHMNRKQVLPVVATNGEFVHGIAAPSVGRAPFCNPTDNPISGDLAGSMAYAFDIYPGNTFFSFNTDDPSFQNIISPITIVPFGGSFDAINLDFMYIIDYNTNFLKKVYVATGEVFNVGLTTPVGNQYWTGITVDKTTNIMYGISTDMTESYLYTIDMVTASTTVIGLTGIPGAIDIAIDGTGQMYSFDIVSDQAFYIDKETGLSGALGSLGYDANYAQGMGWDPVNDIIYLAAFNNATMSGELRILDRVTGNTTLVGAMGGDIDGLAFPGGGMSWLSVGADPVNIPAGGSVQVPVLFNTAGLEPGTYVGNISIASDPDVGIVNIPVVLAVGPGPSLFIAEEYIASAGPVEVPVFAYFFNDLGVFQFTIEYDAHHLAYTGISDWYQGIQDVQVYNPEPGKLTFMWTASSAGITIQGDLFFNLNFTFDGTPEWARIIWSDNPTPREFADFNGNIIFPDYHDGFVVCWIGIPENGARQFIRVFPNPAPEVITVKSDFAINRIEVFSSLGQPVYTDNKPGREEVQLNVSEMPAGIYLVKIHTDLGTGTAKIAVAH